MADPAPYTAANPIQPLGLIGPGTVPVPNIETRTEEQYFKDVTTPAGLKPVSPDAATPAPADPFAGYADAPDPFAGYADAPDQFASYKTADDLDVKSTDELNADRKGFDPVAYFASNPNAASDPAKLQKLLAVYRKRREEGLTAGGVISAAVKETPGLVGNILGGVKRLGERAIDVTVQPVANVVLGTLTGDLFDEQKRNALFAETRKVVKKAVSETAAGSEAATVGLVDLTRTGLRKIEAEQHKPTYPGLFPPTPPKPGEFPGLYPEKPVKPLTDQELLAQISDDASFRQNAAEILKGEGEAAKNFGLDKETLAKQGIELDEKAIEQLSLVDPITMVATGGAFKLVGLGGKVLGTARTLEGVQYAAGKLADAAKWATGKTVQGAGKVITTTGTVLKGSGTTAATIAGVSSAVTGGGIPTSLIIGGGIKMTGRAARAFGPVLEHAGKAFAGGVGAPPISANLQRLLSIAAAPVKVAKPIVEGAAKGVIAAAPFAVAADSDEQAGALLGAGAALGAGHAVGEKTFRVVKDSAARHYFDENRPVLPDVPSPGYGRLPELDALNETQMQKLSAQDASEINNFREILRPHGGEIYNVDPTTWRQKVAEEYQARTGKEITPEQLDRFQEHHALFDVSTADGKKIVYLNGDATGLQHDAGHIFDALLSKDTVDKINAAIDDAFPKEKIEAFRKLYSDRVGFEITPEEAKSEFRAEQFAALFNNVPVTELNAPKNLLSKFVDVVAEGAEILGVDIGKGKTTPNLNAPVSVGIRKLFLNAAGEVARRNVEGGGPAPTNVTPLPPTPPPAPAPAGPGPVAPPTNVVPMTTPTPTAPAGTNLRVTPEPVAPFKQTSKTPEARVAAAKRATETGVDIARAEAKKNEGSANSRIIEKISDSMESGSPVVQIEHLGITSESTPAAPLGDVARSAEQSAAYPRIDSEASRVGIPSEIVSQHSKNFVPIRWFQSNKGKLKLVAMSLDKVITNIKLVSEAGAKNPKIAELIPYPTENGRLTGEGWRQVTEDAQAYSENQSNGRKGDGGRLTVPEAGLSIPAENPTYVPKPLAPERANFQNLLQGLETPLTSKPGSKGTGPPGNIKGQLLAEANLRRTETPAIIEPKRVNKQAYADFPGRTVQEVNPLRNEFERRGFNHRDLLKVTEEINAKDIISASPRPDINYKAPVTDVIRGGFLPSIDSRLKRNANFPTPSEETFYWISPKGEIFEAGKKAAALEDSARAAGSKTIEEPSQGMFDEGWDFFSIDPRIERFEIGNGEFLESNQKAAIKKWSDTLGFRMQDYKGNLHDFTKEVAAYNKEQKINEVHAPGNFLPNPTEFRHKNLQGRTVEEFSDSVLKATPEQWKTLTDGMTGGLTGGAWNLGLGLKNASDVAVLKSYADKFSDSARAAMKAGDFDSAFSQVTRGQFFREAYEAATGTGSAGAAFKRGAAGMETAKPPFPITEKTQGTATVGGDTTTVTIGESGAQFLPAEELGTIEQPPELRIVPKQPAAAGGTPPIEPPAGTVIPPPVAAGRFQPAEQLEPDQHPELKVVPKEATTSPVLPPGRGMIPPPVAAKEDKESAKFLPEPSKEIQDLAKKYAEDTGIPYAPKGGYAEINPDLSKRLAEFYNDAKSDPTNPEVAKSYAALIKETEDQGKAILAAGYKIEPWGGAGEPYKDSASAIADVRDNKHLFFRKTSESFGTGESNVGNPMLAESNLVPGQSANDVFRWVHDFFGHSKEGFQFGPRGEFNAWRAHSEMYSPEAQGALAGETLAQNSWVNFGPQLEGKNIPLKDRPFAEQKNLVVPQELIAEAAKFQPRTEAGRKLEEKGYEIRHFGEMGNRSVVIVDPDKVGDPSGGAIARIQSIQLSPKKAEIAFVSKNKGAPAGLGEVLYREVGSRLQDDGVKSLGGHVIRPEPLVIRKKIFGGFKKLTVNDEPATYAEAIATAERLRHSSEGINEVAAIEPINEITAATKFLPGKRDAQGRPLDKEGNIDYVKWQKEGLAARKKQQAEPIEKSVPKGKVSVDQGDATGWVLPSKEFVPLDAAFHEQYLANNADELNKRFNTKFSETSSVEDRLDALNAGFVRLRNQGGSMRVEANAERWRNLKTAVLNTLTDREGKIDNLVISLLNRKGQQVDSASAPRLHELSGPEKFQAISDAVGSLRSGGTGAFLPVGDYWMDKDGEFIPAPRGHEKAARVILADLPDINHAGIYDEMFSRGYTRVISGDKEFHVDSAQSKMSDLNRAQRSAITDEAKKRGQDLIFNGRPVGGAFLPAEGGLPGIGIQTKEEAGRAKAARRISTVKKNNPEAVTPQYARDENGEIIVTPDGTPKPLTLDYDFINSPLAKEAAKGLKGVKREEAAAVALGDELVKVYREVEKNPDIKAGAKWYSTARTRLKKVFGDDAKFFAELLGATSARTPVDINYRFALDAYNQFKAGAYDKTLAKYREGKKAWETQDLGDFPGGEDATRGQFIDWWVNEHDLGVTQSNGKKFGMNSRAVLRVLDGSWAAEVQGPKTPNFAGNLTGETFEATIDVWAARTLHRLANEGGKNRWRILPENETGVTDTDFYLGQAAYRAAAKKLGIKPDALQAVLWFAEKEHWEKKGWTRGAGAAKSDFNVLLNETERAPSGELRMKTPQTGFDFGAEVTDIKRKK